MATIIIEDVWKQFRLQTQTRSTLKEALIRRFSADRSIPTQETFWALKGVSFDVERGESFGIIGNNGSGKSTLLKMITGISKPTRGRVTVNGRLSALLELGAGFHPEFSGRENIFLNGAILGLSRKELERHFDSIVAFSELERFIDNPVKTYSSGMYMRLAFSIAIHVDPDILLVDEVLAVGDAAFQQKCYDQILRFKHSGKTIVLVSHSLSVVKEICQRAAWIDAGVLRALGNTDSVMDFYSQQIADSVGRNKEVAERLLPSDQVSIRNLRVLDEFRSESAIVRGERPATFVFDLSSRLEPGVLNLLVRIVRTDGTCCYEQRIPLKSLTDSASEGRVELSVPELRLLHGTYNLHVCVVPADQDITYDEKFFNFAVDSEWRGAGIANLGAVSAWLPSTSPLLDSKG